MSEKEIALVICDDHRVLTDAIAAIVGTEPGLRMAADPVDNAAEAVALSASLQPDVVLMDIELIGSESGIEATRRIKQVSPDTKVIVVSGHTRSTILVEAVEAGASGFLDKNTPIEQLLAAVRSAAAGESLIDSSRLVGLMAQLAEQRRSEHDGRDRLARLTPREREILLLLVEGCRSEVIAERLYISTATARTHISNTLTKLGVQSQLQAVALATRYLRPDR